MRALKLAESLSIFTVSDSLGGKFRALLTLVPQNRISDMAHPPSLPTAWCCRLGDCCKLRQLDRTRTVVERVFLCPDHRNYVL